jgi:hypothetical protein
MNNIKNPSIGITLIEGSFNVEEYDDENCDTDTVAWFKTEAEAKLYCFKQYGIVPKVTKL